MTKLEEYMKENNLSVKQLAEECNVRANIIERLIAGKDFRNAPLYFTILPSQQKFVWTICWEYKKSKVRNLASVPAIL